MWPMKLLNKLCAQGVGVKGVGKDSQLGSLDLWDLFVDFLLV